MRSKKPSRAQRVVLLARAYPGRTFLLLLLAAVGLYVLASRLIPSESGAVRGALSQVRDAILAGNPNEVLDRVSPDFYEDGIDKQALETYLRRELPTRPVEHLVIILRELKVQDDTAVADVSVRSVYGVRYLPSDWTLGLEKVHGRWLLRRAAPTRVAGHPATSFRAVLHFR
jgi:hypothetical protein